MWNEVWDKEKQMAELEIYVKTLGDMGTNCYILVNHETDECVVFDPGAEAGVLKEIFDTEAFHLKGIFLTHGHFDHTGAVKALKDAYQVPIYASEIEAKEVLNNVQVSMTGMFGLPYTLSADHLLKDGEEVSIIGTTIKCILTPGHTSGGMSFYCEPLQSVIVGDTLFQESVGRTDFPTGSASVLVRSIREKLFTLPEDTKVFPGHMGSTTIGWEKKNNPFCSGDI